MLRSCGFWWFWLLVLPVLWHQAEAAAPDATVAGFYGWYLRDLNAGRNPIRDQKTLSVYVSKALIRRIEREMRSPNGLDQDYFIKAQDYMGDWVGHITIGQAMVRADTAQVDVNLGVATETKKHLQLALVKEDGTWKISRVQATE
jgi:hypothetical protein